MSLLYKSHPWHGVPIGVDAPRRVTVYVEMVPTDTVKYELDKDTGLLTVDRPQKYSNVPRAFTASSPRRCAASAPRPSARRRRAGGAWWGTWTPSTSA